ITAKTQKDSLFVTAVEYKSPAWESGVGVKSKIISIDGEPATLAALEALSTGKKAGDVVAMEIEKKGKVEQIKITLETELSRSFEIKPMTNPDDLQKAIYKGIFEGGK
ncbi:MAG: PDZ domain-containing protein, partial [Mucilaginibacter sp.]